MMDADPTSAAGRSPAAMEDAVRFLVPLLGFEASQIQRDTDLSRDLGCEGDDFFELMEKFVETFPGDYSDYRWYFHHGPEAGPGPYVRLTDGRPIPHIPVTPQLLLDSARAGRWIIEYPAHTEPVSTLGLPIRPWTLAAIALGLALAAAYVWFAVNFHH